MRLVVIGAGAAGMMAAGRALELGAQVTIIEHARKSLLKLGITGKGRCNLTNNTDVAGLVKNTPQGGKFLYGAFSRFNAQDVMAFFEARNVPLKTERGARVFPASDRAFDIVDALRAYASGARMIFAQAQCIAVKDGQVVGVQTDHGLIPADAVILASGGKSYPATGSDGSGYTLAEQLGHQIITPEPSLVALDAERTVCAPLAGLGLKNVELQLVQDEKIIFREMGELLFTHAGISGPIVLSASVHLRGAEMNSVQARLDLKPALDSKQLDVRILREIAAAPNIQFSNFVPKILPKSMTGAICDATGIAAGEKLNTLTKEKRHMLVRIVKAFHVGQVSKRGFDEAVVTAGGVSIKQVDPKTMKSKLIDGLYFAGEILDVDAYTGGFNLQIAWSTGRAAAEGACGMVRNRKEKI